MENTMDDATLCREVAVKVFKATEYLEASGIHSAYYSRPDGQNRAIRLDWADAGRVVEVMREKGFDFSLRVENPEVCRWLAMFGKVRRTMHYDDGTWDTWDAVADTMPRAVFLAALKAVGGAKCC